MGTGEASSITNQKFRDGVPLETKAYTITKPARSTLKLNLKQRLAKNRTKFAKSRGFERNGP
jgi:hypothetical protein